MNVGIAMTLLISEVGEDPWRGKVFTFNERPKLRKIKGDSASSKWYFIEHLAGGERVDFRSNFNRILQLWISEKLTRDQMVNRVFLFSDRELHEASKNFIKGEYKEVFENYWKRGVQSA
ncbi:hypothetical protein Acr_10g0003860 [Actinidia rufa]|uniref:DUF7788 domain-containing protein n=1 Tax=Actinidia rufa TaxID=165716 RepID=A0A7J0F8M9_9ERIC|nr:hypothetical protein Acr_10g0003860 [Actinidia rufa]